MQTLRGRTECGVETDKGGVWRGMRAQYERELCGSVWVCARVLGRGEESGKLRGRKKKNHPDAVREHTKRKGKRQLQCLGTDNVVEQRHSMTR